MPKKPHRVTNSEVVSCVERATGIEPALSAWEADVLPLNYARAAVAERGQHSGRRSGLRARTFRSLELETGSARAERAPPPVHLLVEIGPPDQSVPTFLGTYRDHGVRRGDHHVGLVADAVIERRILHPVGAGREEHDIACRADIAAPRTARPDDEHADRLLVVVEYEDAGASPVRGVDDVQTRVPWHGLRGAVSYTHL